MKIFLLFHFSDSVTLVLTCLLDIITGQSGKKKLCQKMELRLREENFNFVFDSKGGVGFMFQCFL